jgi:hypothetical protein
VVESAPTDHSYKVPGGGFVSTAEDLVRFGVEIAEPRVLDAAAVALALTPMQTNDGTLTGYGMGWSRRRAAGGQTLYGHSGGQPGSRTYLLVDPGHDVVVALLTNLDGAPLGAADAERIRGHFVAVSEGRVGGDEDIDPVGHYDLHVRGEPDHTVSLEIRSDDGALRAEVVAGDVNAAFQRVVVQGHRVVAFGFTDRVVQLALHMDGDAVVGAIDGPKGAELTGRRR